MLKKKYLHTIKKEPKLSNDHQKSKFVDLSHCSDENQQLSGNNTMKINDKIDLKYKVFPKEMKKEIQNDNLEFNGRRNAYGSLQEEFRRNSLKIERLSSKLQELYTHYQNQTQNISKRRQKAKFLNIIQSQNQHLEEDIKKVKQLLENSLMEEEKKKLNDHFQNSK